MNNDIGKIVRLEVVTGVAEWAKVSKKVIIFDAQELTLIRGSKWFTVIKTPVKR